MNWAIIVVVVILLGIGYYLYTNPLILSGLSSGSLQSTFQSTINLPTINANPTSYLNKNISIDAELEDLYATSLSAQFDYQHGIENQMYQYFSSNQTQYSMPLVLPNQPNRVWQYGSLV